MKKLFSLMIGSLVMIHFSSCCDGDDPFTPILSIDIIDGETGLTYFRFGGIYFAGSLEIFEDDFETPANFEPVGDDGRISLYLDADYGSKNGEQVERLFYFRLLEVDVDTLIVNSRQTIDQCNEINEDISSLIFNDSTYITSYDLVK